MARLESEFLDGRPYLLPLIRCRMIPWRTLRQWNIFQGTPVALFCNCPLYREDSATNCDMMSIHQCKNGGFS
jgi:hypothetical protein